MALFGKKSPADTSSAVAPTAPDKKSRGFGFSRKKPASDNAAAPVAGDANAGGAEDFSDFSQFSESSSADTLAAAPQPTNGAATVRDAGVRRAPTVKNGTSIGLNIGSDSIKVVEVQAKGTDIAVTALGRVPTPAESISNGVVMSVGALQHAIRDAMKQAGVKSKRVTLSVAGTGALVVRVIEVPRMSDKELMENMSVDADRYIPFPPSEVIMDFKALRELPSDPDSPNMDVLLAAAQREIIDLHVKVLEEAKLDPRAIEVEPLAAARALMQTASSGAQAEEVDYNDVSAIINIGATGTEISVLRGDILVFTRTVPNGGNALTQALVDYMGLPWPDAERVKLEWADALPPHDIAQNGATANAATEDWGALDAQVATPDVAPVASEDPSQVDAASQAAADPFDDDFFQQGPENSEPKSQHGQKEENSDSAGFDFADFKFSDEDTDSTPEEASSVTETSEADGAAATEPAASLDLDDAAFTLPEPATTEAEPAPSGDFNFAFPESTTDEDTGTESPASTLNASNTPAMDTEPEAAGDTAFSLDLDEPSTPPQAATIAAADDATHSDAIEIESAPAPSAWDLSNFDEPTPKAGAPSVAETSEESEPGDSNAAFDIDSFFSSTPETAATAAAVAEPSDSLEFGTGLGDDLSDFGVGLTADTSHIDAATVHSILHPLLEELAGEIRRSLEYHASRYPDAVVRRITLIGGGAELKNMDAYLTQTLGIPTTIGDPFSRLTMRTPQLPDGYIERNAPLYTVALGLALRELIQ